MSDITQITVVFPEPTITAVVVDLAGKQNVLVSGTNIKTVGGISLLGAGDIGALADAYIASAATWNAKQAALVSETNIKTVNGASVLGAGNIAIAEATAANVATIITGATEKTTPVDADQLGITDSAASGALKRLTFANLWAWVKSKLDTNLTIAGTKTFSGQTELTGQSATNGTSAMTRELVDASLIRTKTYHFVLVPAALNWGETHVGTGTLAQQAGGFSLRSGTSAGGIAYIRSDASVAVRNWQKNVSGKRNTVDWSRRTIIHASIINFDTSGSDTVMRMLFGIPYNQTTAADFTNAQKGIGFKIINSALWVHYSNGTTAASTSTGQTLTGFIGYDLAIDSDGSGNWTAYVNGSSVATGTGAPTGLSAEQNHCVAISITNGTTAAQRYFDLTSLYSRQC